MDARIRRIASDYEQIKKDFAGHKNIVVTPIGDEPPQKYHVTYYVNGIYLQPDGRIETLGRHEVEIELHSEYPRYKPICKIQTPIWHPNFRDGQICIGDIWGAGESLTDIIINIGDMIQYKSWNSYSPLSVEAAAWAMDNKHLFPVGNVDLYIADYASVKDTVEIDLFGDNGEVIGDESASSNLSVVNQKIAPVVKEESENNFDITAEELAGIEFIPTAERMLGASASVGQTVKVKISFNTILAKGILWALIGAILGFGCSELAQKIFPNSTVASMMGYRDLSKYFELQDKADKLQSEMYNLVEAYAKEYDLDMDEDDVLTKWLAAAPDSESKIASDWYEAYNKADDKLYEAYIDDFDSDGDDFNNAIAKVSRTHTGIWAGFIALFIGLSLGIGEGIYYGSKQNAGKYAAIGAVVSLVIGGISGYLAQWMYASMLSDDSGEIAAALVRGAGWAIMGLGVGLAVGLIKPDIKRIISCTVGGAIGAFVGGFLFNFVGKFVPNDMAARGVAIVLMGILIGVGVGLMEQFVKSAWLKVIRGEFEGKEYLVFPGTTSIGNNSKNTIVLFKDKMVSSHHCDIVMQGSKYVIKDCGSSMGTVVNGIKTTQRVLRQGDAIAIGNSVLVFNTK